MSTDKPNTNYKHRTKKEERLRRQEKEDKTRFVNDFDRLIETAKRNFPGEVKDFDFRPKWYKMYVMDNITGVGRQLRQFGCDVELAKSNSKLKFGEKLERSFNDNRIIVISGKAQIVTLQKVLQKLIAVKEQKDKKSSGLTPHNFIYDIHSKNNSLAKSLSKTAAIEFNKNLKMKALKEDIFSRCSRCNYGGFFEFSSENMCEMILNIVTARADENREKLHPEFEKIFLRFGRILGGHFNRYLQTIFVKRIFPAAVEDRGFTFDENSAQQHLFLSPEKLEDARKWEESQLRASFEKKKVWDLDFDSDDSEEIYACQSESEDEVVDKTKPLRPKPVVSEHGTYFPDTSLIYPNFDKLDILNSERHSDRDTKAPTVIRINSNFFKPKETVLPDGSTKINNPYDFTYLDINLIRPYLQEKLEESSSIYKICPFCGSIYWEGCHMRNSEECFDEIFDHLDEKLKVEHKL